MSTNDDEDYKKAIRERALELLQTAPKKEKVGIVKQKRHMSDEQKIKVLDRLEKARVKAREVIAQKSKLKSEMGETLTPKVKPQPKPKEEQAPPVQQSKPVEQQAPPVQPVQPVQPAPQPVQPVQQIKATYFKPTMSHYKKHFGGFGLF